VTTPCAAAPAHIELHRLTEEQRWPEDSNAIDQKTAAELHATKGGMPGPRIGAARAGCCCDELSGASGRIIPSCAACSWLGGSDGIILLACGGSGDIDGGKPATARGGGAPGDALSEVLCDALFEPLKEGGVAGPSGSAAGAAWYCLCMSAAPWSIIRIGPLLVLDGDDPVGCCGAQRHSAPE